jgi:hypothetical protein
MRNATGAIFDPSKRQGLTAKLLVGATRVGRNFPRRRSLPQAARARAKALPTARAGLEEKNDMRADEEGAMEARL